MKTNILILSAGRRVALIKAFKNALKKLGDGGNIISADISMLAPSFYVSDKYYVIPKLDSIEFIPSLIEIIKKEEIKAVIPTIDLDLPVLAKNKERIEKETGTKVIISNEKAIEICSDKKKTHDFFIENNIPCPKLFQKSDFISYPLLIKPAKGFAAVGISKVNNKEELSILSEKIENPLLQEFVKGKEHTIDLFSDFEGNVISIVPRKRLEIRGGEVVKGVTVYNKEIIELSKNIAEKLNFIGPITLQCFLNEDGLKFFEINPRFGGGAPLSIKSGANSPEWIIKLLRGEKLEIKIGQFERNLFMLRYDDAIFIKGIKNEFTWREE
ncbi:MAG: ATP-grasp domain-containing protein [Nanoarchaeota archaeon]|nr:ATP-grasp domain-containing protein [Nanoarchaeota archaeon]